MTRTTALQILNRHLKNPILLQHSLFVEAAMRTLAGHLGGDVEEWGITGLLHDADYEKAKGHPEKHGLLLFELESNSIPTLIEQAIKSHNAEYTHVVPQGKMDWTLVCCDELAGIIQEMADKQKQKNIHNLTSELVLQKLTDKHVYKDVEKKYIFQCEEKLGLPLQKLVTIVLSAMQQVQTPTHPTA